MQIRWQNLPDGITGPDEITIGPGAYRAEVELAAAETVEIGSFDDLRVEATSKFAGQPIKVSSKPARLDVVRP